MANTRSSHTVSIREFNNNRYTPAMWDYLCRSVMAIDNRNTRSTAIKTICSSFHVSRPTVYAQLHKRGWHSEWTQKRGVTSSLVLKELVAR